MATSNSHEFIIEKARNTVPAMRYDGKEDFDSWRKRAVEKLYDLLGLPLEECEDQFTILSKVDCGSYTRIDFTFQSEDGYIVPAGFMIPKGVTFPCKTAICIQGHTSGMHISLGIKKFERDPASIVHSDFAIQAMKKGYCAAILEQRHMGTCGESDLGIPKCVTKYTALSSLLLGRTCPGERVWDAQKLIDVLEKHFSEYVDMNQLICMGNSGGGTTTFYLACVDERIKLAIPSCYVCEFDYSIIPLHHCGCNYVPGIRKYFDMGDMGGLIAPRKVVVVCGIKDPEFPIAGVQKSYDRMKSVYDHLGKGDICRLVKGPEAHQFYPEETWPVIDELMEME